MKTTTTTHPAALRLLAALFFFLLLAPMAAGEDVSTPPTYWEKNVADKIANDNDGDGTVGKPILIATAEELAYFAKKVNEGEAIDLASGGPIKPDGKDHEAGGFKDYYFALSADINLEKHYWTPIGTEGNPFKGYFDGKGHCVSGLKVNVNEKSDPAYAGLFGNARNGTIQNLGVRLAQAGVRVEAKEGNVYAGGLAAITDSVYNCYVEGPGTVKAIITEEKSDPSRSYYVYAGGIAGKLNACAIHCYSTVDVKAEGPSDNNYAGGIAGQIGNSSLTSNTYATGTVEAVGATFDYAGGIVGYVGGSSKFEYNLALNDSVKGSYRNRMVGDNESKVTFSSNYASPDMLVNGTVVSDESDKNGSSKDLTYINLNDTLKKIWKNGWTFPEDGNRNLPQLQLITGDEDSNPSYSEWPTTSPQPIVDPVAYLPHGIAGTGKGTSWSDLILIADEAELAYLAKQVNAGNSLVVGKKTIANEGEHEGFKGIYFALANDIDLREKDWKPIGTFSNPFNGNFDGQGYCVSGLKVDGAVEYAGLFGCAKDGTLRNIGVHLAKEGVYGIKAAGGIAGMAANINNCYVVGDGMIKAGSKEFISVGGIVGNIFGSLSNCYATIDVEGEGIIQNHVGGIVGYGEGTSSVSYTYSTGNVFAKGESINYAGGICGITYGELYSNLATNGKIEGDDLISHRIVGRKENNEKFDSNYASATIQVNGAPITGGDADSRDGAPSYLSTFVDDLKDAGWSNEKGWEDFSSGTNLPQLMMLKQDGSGYETWNPKTQYLQPSLTVSDNLPPCPKLHIVSPTGGNLIVKDKDKKELPNGSDILPGTLLTLAYTEDANYHFSEYLSGSDKSSLKSYGSNSITMTDDDLYLSATFTLYPKLHIVSSTGGTLTVTDKDGNKLPDGSDILPGTVLTLANTEEANYRFSEYLSGSDKSSLKSYGSNSITMPDADLYLSATFTYQEPEPPYVPPTPVYYSVYLPQVEGATTDPGSGKYEVESRDSFRFYLKIDSAYSESQPVVTTDRGETLKPRSSDGAYLVNDVCSDVEVFIDGIFKNPPPVANEAISTDALVPQIWSEGSMLCIRMPEALPSAPVRIFTMDGRLYASFDSTPGLNRRQLPTGIYIVRVGDTACKVIVK